MNMPTTPAEVIASLQARVDENTAMLRDIDAGVIDDAWIAHNVRGPVHYAYDTSNENPRVVSPTKATRFADYLDAQAIAESTFNGAKEGGCAINLAIALEEDSKIMQNAIDVFHEALAG